MHITKYKQYRHKSLKRGHRDESRELRAGLDEIFSHDDAPCDMDDAARHPLRLDPRVDEFANFIEENDLEQDDQTQRYHEEMNLTILTLRTCKDYLIHAKKGASPGPKQTQTSQSFTSAQRSLRTKIICEGSWSLTSSSELSI